MADENAVPHLGKGKLGESDRSCAGNYGLANIAAVLSILARHREDVINVFERSGFWKVGNSIFTCTAMNELAVLLRVYSRTRKSTFIPENDGNTRERFSALRIDCSY